MISASAPTAALTSRSGRVIDVGVSARAGGVRDEHIGGWGDIGFRFEASGSSERSCIQAGRRDQRLADRREDQGVMAAARI